MAKVRRIDWSPDEWIAGTAGLLTRVEAAVYMAVLMVIYSRGGECPNDPVFIKGFFRSELPVRASRQQRAADTMIICRALERLIELGKLDLTTGGHGFTNGRANAELTKAQDRIESAANAGFVSGRKRANREPTASQPRANLHPMGSGSSNFNDLTRTSVRIINHQPSLSSSSSIFTDAARDPAQVGGSGPRASRPQTMKERMAALAALNRRKFLA